MMSRLWRGLTVQRMVVVLGIVLVVGLWGVRSRWAGDRGTVRLSGQTTLNLRGVSYGTNHIGPPVLVNRLLDSLPGPWVMRFRLGPIPRVVTDGPQLLLWTETRRHAEHPGRPGVAPETPPPDQALVDSRGFEVPTLGSAVWGGAKLIGDDRVDWDAWALEAFPRRSRQIVIRLHGPDGLSQRSFLGELTAPNPVAGVYPVWTPEPLPVTKTSEGERFTMRRLEVNAGSREAGTGFPTGELMVAVGPGLEPETGWAIGGIVLSDATGNRVEVASPDSIGDQLKCEPVDGGLRCRFPWVLWSDEAAWRLEVEFIPRTASALPSDQVLMLRDVLVPAPEGLTRIDTSDQVGGVQVRVMALVGAHAVLSGREHDVQDQVTLELEPGPIPKGHRLMLVGMVDDQRRPAPLVMSAENRSFGLRPGPAARRLSLGIAIYPRRVVSYQVRPEFVNR
jgi:hypothetical protein